MKIKDDVWEAEKLIRRRLRNGRFEYLVKWRNYTIRQSTWEPEENILDSHLLVNFNSALDRDVRLCGIRGIPSVRGRRRKRHINRHYPWPKPTKRRRHSESENRRPENISTPRPRGRSRGRPRIRPLLTPIRDTNQHVGEEEIDDVVEEAIRRRSVEGVRLGSSQVPLSALRQRLLVLTDVTYEGVTVTIKEDIGQK